MIHEIVLCSLLVTSVLSYGGSIFDRSSSGTCPSVLTAPTPVDSCKLNVRRRIPRIVQGQNAEQQQFPYMVLLKLYKKPFCAGFILTSKYAGTAAHCLKSLKNVNRVGDFIASTDTVDLDKGVDFPVSNWYYHPAFNVSHTLDMDVGVINIFGDFFTANVQPIKLNTIDPPAGSSVIIVGWGHLWTRGPASKILQWTEVNVVERAACLAAFRSNIGINNLCAAYPGRDSCQLDSGGPLVWNGVVAGIVSWGATCADPIYPSVYVNVAAPAVYDYLNAFITNDPEERRK